MHFQAQRFRPDGEQPWCSHGFRLVLGTCFAPGTGAAKMQRVGDLALYTDPTLDAHVLHNTLTSESVRIAASPGGWLLLQDAEHGLYVASAEGQQHWCVDLLEFNIVGAADGPVRSRLVVDSQGTSIDLQAFKSKFKTRELPVPVAGAGHPVQMTIFQLEHYWDGSRVFWSCRTLHSEVFGHQEGKTPHQWYQNWWTWWSKAISTHSWHPECHLRRAAQQKRTDDSRDLETRIFPEPSMSTLALALLLPRWSQQSSHRKKSAHLTTAWSGFLDGILQVAFGERTVTARFFLDPRASCSPGLPVEGLHPVDIVIENGVVDCSSLDSSAFEQYVRAGNRE